MSNDVSGGERCPDCGHSVTKHDFQVGCLVSPVSQSMGNGTNYCPCKRTYPFPRGEKQ